MYQGYEVRVSSRGQVCEHSQIAMYGGKRPDVSETHGFHSSLANVLHRWWAEDITKRTASAAKARSELGEVVSHVRDMAKRAKRPVPKAIS